MRAWRRTRSTRPRLRRCYGLRLFSRMFLCKDRPTRQRRRALAVSRLLLRSDERKTKARDNYAREVNLK